jgi:hypothetical protein
MKKVICTLAGLALFASASASSLIDTDAFIEIIEEKDDKDKKPVKQKVYSIIKQTQTNEWYEIQAELWKEELANNPENADAWLNYYTAKRMHKIMGGGTTHEDLKKIVSDVQKSIPETFEAHYIKGWNTNIGDDKITHLEKAYSIDPSRPGPYDGMLTHYELTRDKLKVTEFCEKIFDANDISSQIYAWNYNMLNSVEEDAILITVGDNDTYPSWILQQSQGIRIDVKIMNISLLGVDSYRDAIFDEMNIKRFDLKNSGKTYWEQNLAMCQHLREHSSKPIYFASCMNSELYEAFKDELYLVGLAFKWSDESFDNIAALRKNYEKHFLKDNLRVNLVNDLSESVVDQMNGSYIMPLITLHNHYKETEEESKMDDLDAILQGIAEKAGSADAVQDIISPPINEVVSLVVTDPRDARYGFLVVNDSLEASQMEIPEDRYEKFLLDLLKQKRYEDLVIAKSEQIDWNSLLIEQYKDLAYEEYFKHGEPGGEAFPVVNVSYEAAVLYCEWLTNIYNNLEHRKKKYKRVEFRLPTEAEWEMMAHAGQNTKYKFPWGDKNELGPKQADTTYNHDQIQNQKGCYLANTQTNKTYRDHHPDDEKSCPVHDGGVFPVKVYSYNPNDFGLYCMIGNVAEMVAEKGISKGGGWNTIAENCEIQKHETYDGPNANLGFRVVMQIIEK